MSGLFEHLAAFDEGDQSKRRQIVAVANKRVADNFGAFLSNATSQEELDARLALVENDIKKTVQAVVAEYNGDTFDSTYAAVIAGWEDLPRGEKGQWGKADSTDIGAPEDGISDIESELADAPSAVGQKAGATNLGGEPTNLSGKGNPYEYPAIQGGPIVPPGHTTRPAGPEDFQALQVCDPSNGGCQAIVGPDGQVKGIHHPDLGQTGPGNTPFQSAIKQADAAWDGGGAVVRESLPKADESGLDGPSPKIDKSNAGDEKGHKHTPVPDTQTSGSPHPTETQSVTDGRGDAEKGTSDLKHESPELTSDTLKKETLPTGDDWAGFADGGVSSGPHTDTFDNGSQTDPVSSDKGEGVLSSNDPDRNPIADLWAAENQVQAAIAAHEREKS